ncbi:MAG: hypothetical protein AUG51_02320 [Acidobacteria bacterium 13_1_20CM_3_53_8]|nr:MAG: hypothetical protein AUG51_02320 [Acidobacteria bacterium 13_1_20CM_3_53_8]
MTRDENVFPARLLNASREERKTYFREYQVLHPRIELIFNRVMRLIREPGGKQIIIVVGPTGAGKSFLIRWLVNELEYEWSKIQHTDPGRIPVAWMEVPAKDTRQPSWGDYYVRALEAFEERHIEKKVLYADVSLDVKYVDGKKKLIIEEASIRKYRRALESCFKFRDPLIFLLDEAHQLVNTGGLRVEEQTENLKSVANMTRTLHGLFGTYKILDLLSLDDDEESDQLIRRSCILHFRRYLDNEDERFIFDSTVNSFLLNMPLKRTPDLSRHFDYLYERTLGCVGILRDWLVAAYTEAVDEGAATLQLKHLKKTCLISKARSIKMLQQFAKYEDNVDTVLDSDDDFEEKIKEIKHRTLEGQEMYGPEKDERSHPKESKPRRGRKRPGRQNPKRRSIGRREGGQGG